MHLKTVLSSCLKLKFEKQLNPQIIYAEDEITHHGTLVAVARQPIEVHLLFFMTLLNCHEAAHSQFQSDPN
jgi:hypothetical protein